MRTRTGATRWLLALLLASAPFLAACPDDDQAAEDNFVPPPPVVPVVECTEENPAPGAASVAAGCGTISGQLIDVEVLVTDTPPGEGVVGAALDLRFVPQVGTFLLTFDSCFAGPALGNPASLEVECGVSASNATELVAGVTQLTQGPGVAVTGTQLLMTIRFRVTGLGDSPIQFLLPNDPNGSALLRRSAADPSLLEAIPGITFSGATVTGS
jgi:hypothetical protein